ncbi:hypothetical protein DXG01_015169 [Tephrocybe rancida]|nr:hypothetical protein DXG01_015169 [Tephrocybe rancida]
MPPADNNPATLDGKKPSLANCILDRVKGPKSTKSSSASSIPATPSMEIWTASSAADGKPSLSKRLIAPFKGSKFIKSSSTPSTPAAQSALPVPNVRQDQSKFKGEPASDLTVHVLTVGHPPEGVNVALDGCLTALRVAKEASEWNPVLKVALGGVMAAIDLAKTVRGNSQDMKDILDYIQRLLPILETSAKRLEGHKDDFGKGKNLMTFAITMQAELEKIQQMQSHGLFRRVLQGTPDADSLLGVYKNIGKALEQFKVAFLVAIEHDTSTIQQRAELHKLQTSPTAAHTAYIESDTIDWRTCTLGTRLDVLKGILSWLQQQDSEPVYWLTGPAGIGKTTIAKTISFLAEALEKDSRLAHATLDVQLKQMLIQPWEASTSERVGLPPLIIVVDALDENTKGSVFLEHLLHAVGATKLRGLKFFVTSREDEEISRLCDTLPQGTVLHLQDIQKQTVQADIGLYLRQSLPDIYAACQEHFEKLIKLSDGLFIYAATVVKMVTANDATLTEQMEVIQGIVDLSDRLQLEGLYSHIVRNALAKTTVDVVATVLKKLHAVMYKAHDGLIYTYHASFADYIHQAPTATETEFDPHCNVGLLHAFLANRCYEIMEEQLHFNICGLESSFVKDTDVPQLQENINHNIDSSLKYAVLKWMAHLNSTPDPKQRLQDKPKWFVEKLLLYWMEVVNLLNAKREGMQMLHMLTAWIDKTSSIVNDIGVSSDSKQLVSGGDDKSVRIWDALTGDLVKELKGHTHYVQSVAFSPDGKRVVSGSSDRSVHIWDALTGDLVKVLNGHTEWVQSVTFSPDGKQVVSGSNDQSVCIWDALTGGLLKELKGHTKLVQSVAFSPDGKQVVSGSSDESVCIWDALTGDLVKELKKHTDSVMSVAFSPNGKQVVSGSNDTLVFIWDALTGDCVKELKGHTNSVWSVIFSPDGKQVMSGSSDTSVRIWDALTGDLVKELKGHTHWVSSVAFFPDGKQVVSGSSDESVCIWDALTGGLLKELKGHTKPVQSVAFSSDGKQVVSGGDDKSVCIWDALTGDLVKELNGHTDWVRSVAFSPDGKQVVSGSSDKSVCIWDALTGDLVKELKGHTHYVLSVAFSPDGKQVVSGSNDTSVRIWDALTGGLVKELKGHTNSVWSVAFSDGKQVVSGGDDKSVRIWDALTGDLVKELNGHTDWVRSVAFSPDGKQVVSGSRDKSVNIWDALTGDLVKKLRGHMSSVWSVVFSPDGKQVVSGSSDKSVCIWDALAGDIIKELNGHTNSVVSVAFSPDGKQVVSGSHDTSVRIWDVSTGDPVDKFKGKSLAGSSDQSLTPETIERISDIYLWSLNPNTVIMIQ